MNLTFYLNDYYVGVKQTKDSPTIYYFIQFNDFSKLIDQLNIQLVVESHIRMKNRYQYEDEQSYRKFLEENPLSDEEMIYLLKNRFYWVNISKEVYFEFDDSFDVNESDMIEIDWDEKTFVVSSHTIEELTNFSIHELLEYGLGSAFTELADYDD